MQSAIASKAKILAASDTQTKLNALFDAEWKMMRKMMKLTPGKGHKIQLLECNVDQGTFEVIEGNLKVGN